MNIEKTDHLIKKISLLKEKEIKVVSTANIPKAKEIETFDKNQKIAFVFGSEGHGVDPESLNASDEVLKIPVNENVEHLNISHACNCRFLFFRIKLINREVISIALNAASAFISSFCSALSTACSIVSV